MLQRLGIFRITGGGIMFQTRKIVGILLVVAIVTSCSLTDTGNSNASGGTGGSAVAPAAPVTSVPPVPGTVTVESVTEMIEVLAVAQPGDVIKLKPGIYSPPAKILIDFPDGLGGTRTKEVYFHGASNGTADQAISLTSENPANPAIINGWGCTTGTDIPGYGVLISGDYWNVSNLIIQNCAKGLILDNANHCTVSNVEIRNIAQEGIHVRDGSSWNTFENVWVHDTGKDTQSEGFGEGIYIGSDNGVWFEGDATAVYPVGTDGISGERGHLYRRDVHHNTVRNSKIGPNIVAEPMDIKEGTHDTLVEGNTFLGDGVSFYNWADSFIDIKGYGVVVRYNWFVLGNNTDVEKGIAIVPRMDAAGPTATGLTAHDITVHGNVFTMPDNSYAFAAGSDPCVINVYAWDNIKIPESTKLYGSSRIEDELKTPGYLEPPKPDMQCRPPVPLAPVASAVAATSMNLSWTEVPWATGYRIHTSTASGGPYALLGETLSTSATLSGLAVYSTVYVKITSFNSYGESPVALSGYLKQKTTK